MRRTATFILGLALVIPPAADAGFYIGLGAGAARTESTLKNLGLLPQNADIVGNVVIDNPPIGIFGANDLEYQGNGIGSDPDYANSIAGGQLFAGYRFGSYVGIEIGWTDFGTAEEAYDLPKISIPNVGTQDRQWLVQAETQGAQAFLTGHYPLSNLFEVYAKVGAIAWDTELSGQEPNQLLTPGSSISGRNAEVRRETDGTDVAAALGLELRNEGPVNVRAEFSWFDIEDTDLVYLLSINAVYSFSF